jgi:hypothetical protein
MHAYRRTHWNKIAWGRDFTIETESEQGQRERSDVFLDELQPRDRPDGRIKRVTVKLRFQAYDWYQKTGQDMWKGTCDGDITSKEPIRFTTSTKHKNPEEEEEEDQVDTWKIHIEPAEPKTVPTTGTLEATVIEGQLGGVIEGAMIGELMGIGEWGGAGAWEGGGIGVEAGSFQGGGAAAIEGVQAIEYTHDMGQITTTETTKPGTIDIPEITVKDPERTGTAKWKMIDRETKDTGMNIENDIVLEWKETMEPKQPGLGGAPTAYRRQHTGQIGWAYLIKCPWAVYDGLNADQELEEYIWGSGDIWLAMEKWQRWVLSSGIIVNDKEITLRGTQFGLRKNEVLFVMLIMRSWGMEPLTYDGMRISKRTWFGQIRTEALINWY